jgi:hypothetical protein
MLQEDGLGEKESSVVQQSRGNGVEALELKWSESERKRSAVIQFLCALCYTEELTER